MYVDGVRLKRNKAGLCHDEIPESVAYKRLAAGILLQWTEDFTTPGRTNFCYAGWMLTDFFEMLVHFSGMETTPEEFCAKLMQMRPTSRPKGRRTIKCCNSGRRYYCDFVDGFCVLIRDESGHRYQPFKKVRRKTGTERETPDMRFSGFASRFWNWELDAI